MTWVARENARKNLVGALIVRLQSREGVQPPLAAKRRHAAVLRKIAIMSARQIAGIAGEARQIELRSAIEYHAGDGESRAAGERERNARALRHADDR